MRRVGFGVLVWEILIAVMSRCGMGSCLNVLLGSAALLIYMAVCGVRSVIGGSMRVQDWWRGELHCSMVPWRSNIYGFQFPDRWMSRENWRKQPSHTDEKGSLRLRMTDTTNNTLHSKYLRILQYNVSRSREIIHNILNDPSCVVSFAVGTLCLTFRSGVFIIARYSGYDPRAVA